jgi:hypothetical protein
VKLPTLFNVGVNDIDGPEKCARNGCVLVVRVVGSQGSDDLSLVLALQNSSHFIPHYAMLRQAVHKLRGRSMGLQKLQSSLVALLMFEFSHGLYSVLSAKSMVAL